MHILDRLCWSESFEKFLAAKYAAAKRFGLEGAETLIPGMKALIDTSADLGVEAIVMGMPHRGAPRPPHPPHTKRAQHASEGMQVCILGMKA